MAEKTCSDPLVATVLAREECTEPPLSSSISSPSGRIRPLTRWSLRLLLIPLAPLVYTGLYALIVYYAREPAGSNVLDSPYRVNPKLISYLWFIVSAFILDLNRFGLIGVEAVGVTSKRLAPVNAVKLLWHADWSWSTLTSVVSVTSITVKAVISSKRRQEFAISRICPGTLWRILLLTNIILWIGVPLSGLSFNLGTTWALSHDKAIIRGVNETTFDMREWPHVLSSASSRWTQGLAALPEPPNVLYFPAGLDENVTETFYEDTISTYRDGQWIEYFVAPVVSERVNGTAWGLLVNVSARLAQPERDLRLLDVAGYEKYQNLTMMWGHIESGPLYKCSAAVLAATESLASSTSYFSLPGKGSAASNMHEGMLEMVTWQYYNDTTARADPSMLAMTNSSTIVVSEPLSADASSQYNNPDILSYGISLQIQSMTGRAALSARSRTFSNFTPSVSSPFLSGDYSMIAQCVNYTKLSAEDSSQLTDDQELQMLQCQNAIQTLQQGVQRRSVPLLERLLLSALTCETVGQSSINTTCIDFWYAANLATGGNLYLPQQSLDVQMPALTPERMRLALLKLVGEVTISMMGPGPQPFDGDLTVVKQVHGILLGVVSWKLVLALLVAWAALLCVLAAWALCEPRYIDKLDGYQWFQFGAVWAPELFDGGGQGGREAPARWDGDEDQKFQFHCPLQGIPSTAEAREAKLAGLHGFAGVSLLRRRGRHE